MGHLLMKTAVLAAFWGLAGSCQPLDYSFLSSEGRHKKGGSGKNSMFEFKEGFSSSKLDMVIVLDGQPGMREALKTNLFGEGFLDHFERYDWRLARTNTSVNKAIFAKKKGAPESEGGCPWLQGAGTTLLGWFMVSPVVVGFGFNTLISCIPDDSPKKKAKKSDIPETNGSFLPFELQNKKWREGRIFIDKSAPEHGRVFKDTMTLSGRERPGFFSSEKKSFYEAPEEQGGDSLPLYSVLLSLAKPSHQKQFFRPDSQIIYIVASPADAKKAISGKALRHAVKEAFGRGDRFQLIHAGIPSDSALCRIQFENAGLEEAKPAVRLKKLARELGNKSFSLCSPSLGEDIAAEIKKYIHPPDLL